MKYFNFLFYFIFKGYYNKGEKEIAGLYAVLLVSLIIFSNLLSVAVWILIIVVNSDNTIVTGMVGGVSYGMICLGSWLYFYQFDGKRKAINTFEKSSPAEVQMIRTSVIIYIIVSAVAIVSSLYYFFIHHVE